MVKGIVKTSARSQRGYTFAETMIAAAVLAILGSVLYLGQDRERDVIGASFDRLRAETWAESELETCRAQPETLKVGRAKLVDLPPGFDGTRTVRETAPGLLEVQVRIAAPALPRPYILTTRIAQGVGR